MNHHRTLSSNDLLWLSVTLLILITLSFLFTIQPQDYWWCLRIGRDILSTGTVPVTETLSWSRAGQPILYEPWLSCVAFELTNELGGVPSIFLLRGLLIGLAYGLIWVVAKNQIGPHWASCLVLVAGLAGSNNWVMRAQLFAYPLFVLCLFTLLNWQSGNDKILWILPVTTVLWANLHGSFILSIVLTGSAFVFGKGNRRWLLIILIFMLIGTIITPHGIALWKHLQFMLTVQSNQEYSLEWRPPVNVGWQMNIFFAWVLLLAPFAAYSSRKISVMEWVWFLGFSWLAFSGIRYVIWLLFILVAMTATLLTSFVPIKQDHSVDAKFPTTNLALACVFVSLSLFYLPGIREKWWRHAPPVYASDLTPIRAVEWLKAHPELPGPLWNQYAFGSYLSYAIPSRPVSLDSRFFPFTPEQMDEHVQLSRGSPKWESIFQREGVNLLMLSFQTQPKLIELVESSTQWCEQYHDEDAIIFSRCKPIK